MSDVCLLLEGTFPYVSGGVSAWVSDLIRRLPDRTFSIVYLGTHREARKRMHYEIPGNVVDFQEYYLFDYRVSPERLFPGRRRDYEALEVFLDDMRRGQTGSFPEAWRAAGNPRTRTVDLWGLAHSRQGWQLLTRLYAKEREQPSFMDYFWSWRFIHLPLFSLLRIELPRAGVYHAVSTGYAGLLGALAKLQTGRPFVLTEHGIYTRERKLEIFRADWIYAPKAVEAKVLEEGEFFKEWWIRLFSYLSRLAYAHADEIITLFEGNRRVQIEEGADPAKTHVVPNGVDVEFWSGLKKELSAGTRRVGFVGRVVEIKDVKTFIRACRRVAEEEQNVEFWIIGPTDEEEDYVRECEALARMEGLMPGRIKFLGKVDLKTHYPKLDVVVLTSVSEGQPIVILEAGACGIPVVATDVGACRELVEGVGADDRLLGKSGVITPLYNPEATAAAVLRILRNPRTAARMGEAGRRRVGAFYRAENWLAWYERLYLRCLEEVAWRA